jgi:hypothetical protein
MDEFIGRSSWGLLVARVSHVSEADALFWLGVLVVLGCLVAAGVAAWRGLWLVVGLLLVVAIVAGVLLL